MVGGTSRLDETLLATTMTRIGTMDDSNARMYINEMVRVPISFFFS